MSSPTKRIGTIGELAVAQDLIRREWDVYTAIGDFTKIDILAIKDGVIKRHQVKTISTLTNGVICVEAAKVISRKKVKYSPDDFDYLTVFVISHNRIAYIPLTILHGRTMTLRLEPTKSGHTKRAQNFDDFKDL